MSVLIIVIVFVEIDCWFSLFLTICCVRFEIFRNNLFSFFRTVSNLFFQWNRSGRMNKNRLFISMNQFEWIDSDLMKCIKGRKKTSYCEKKVEWCFFFFPFDSKSKSPSTEFAGWACVCKHDVIFRNYRLKFYSNSYELCTLKIDRFVLAHRHTHAHAQWSQRTLCMSLIVSQNSQSMWITHTHTQIVLSKDRCLRTFRIISPRDTMNTSARAWARTTNK